MSSPSSKPIRFSAHARGYLSRRGFTEAEVRDTIRTATWKATPDGRYEASRNFDYNDFWNGTFYPYKKVRPIFVELATEIVVVTVYTYFF
jgi:hypothetical protein